MLQNSVRRYLAAAQLPEVLADLCEMSRDYCAAIWQLWLGSRLLAEKHHRDKKTEKEDEEYGEDDGEDEEKDEENEGSQR